MNPDNTQRTIAILSYHKIGDPAPGGWESWYYISRQIFREHLELLRDLNYRFIDLPTLFASLNDPQILPPKSALITFDDGYRNNLIDALPIMREMNCPGVVFVPTKFIGALNTWDSGSEPDEPICTWDELRELERGGVRIESHSVSHPAFSGLTPEQQQHELRLSKQTLEQGLGRAVESIAYPFGDGGKDAAVSQSLLEELGYRAAFLYGGGVARLPNADRFRLPRLAMGPDSDLAALLNTRG